MPDFRPGWTESALPVVGLQVHRRQHRGGRFARQCLCVRNKACCNAHDGVSRARHVRSGSPVANYANAHACLDPAWVSCMLARQTIIDRQRATPIRKAAQAQRLQGCRRLRNRRLGHHSGGRRDVPCAWLATLDCNADRGAADRGVAARAGAGLGLRHDATGNSCRHQRPEVRRVGGCQYDRRRYDAVGSRFQCACPYPTRTTTLQPARDRNSVAVLPFVNMSRDEENEYFADGLSEELLNVLAKIGGLRVASRTSAFSFKGTDVDIPTVAQQAQGRTPCSRAACARPASGAHHRAADRGGDGLASVVGDLRP